MSAIFKNPLSVDFERFFLWWRINILKKKDLEMRSKEQGPKRLKIRNKELKRIYKLETRNKVQRIQRCETRNKEQGRKDLEMRRGIRNKEQGPTNLKMRNKELQRFIDAKQGTRSKEFKDAKRGPPKYL